MYGMVKRITWRSIAAILIMLITVAAFVNYFASHPSVRAQLRDTSPILLISLLLLYMLFIGSLALINHATLRICKTRLDKRESLLITMYSSVINFFGPLQSGPAFRAIYFKKQHDINLKSFGTATLMYYGFYALFSGLFLISGLLGWWLVPDAVIIVIAAVGILRSDLALAKRVRDLNLSNWYYLALATLTQVSIQVVIYYFELHSILLHVSLSQVIVYTGAANFAVFVSLTPGAIGFRESFLLFSEKLHHISSNAIVLANTIDRAAYISVLLIAAVVIFSSHTHKRFASLQKQDK